MAASPSTRTASSRAKATAAPAPKVEPGETEQQLKNRLRNEAEREVLTNHKDEFHAIAEEKFKAHNLVFVRRKTEQEKAADKIADLMNQFPELRGQFVSSPVEADVVAQYVPVTDGVDEADPSEYDSEDTAPEPDYAHEEQVQYDHSAAENAVAVVEAPGWPSDEL